MDLIPYLRTIPLYLLAGLAEIGGGWLMWQWLREGKNLVGNWRGSHLGIVWYHPYLAGGTSIRAGVCRVWRYFYHSLSLVGASCGWLAAGQV